MAQYVCNVDTWGSNPSYHQGDVIPDDCPYDVEAAAASGKVVTAEAYKKAHPDWDPEVKAKQEAARKAFPGRDLPTAADPPDPEAEAAEYGEGNAPMQTPVVGGGGAPQPARPKDDPDDPEKPRAVQPPSNPSAPPGSTSTRRTSS